MFEEEIKMEERSSNVGPILLIVAVCLTIVGTAVYVTHEARKGMSQADAKRVVTTMLEQRGPATVHFSIGLVPPTSAEKPNDPHYQLLERAQIITIEKRDKGVMVALTENGAKLLNTIPGTTHAQNIDGTQDIVVPLGTRQLVAVTNVKVVSPSSAMINYTWKWHATSLGDVFDLAGNYAGGFDVWQRAQLAKDFGADLYHGGPVPDEFNATSGWQLARN